MCIYIYIVDDRDAFEEKVSFFLLTSLPLMSKLKSHVSEANASFIYTLKYFNEYDENTAVNDKIDSNSMNTFFSIFKGLVCDIKPTILNRCIPPF